MSITNTKLITYTNDDYAINVVDKYLQNIESKYNFSGDVNLIDFEFDEINNKLWTLDSNGKLYRFDISENSTTHVVSISLEATITVPKYYMIGKRITQNDDNIYYVFSDNHQYVRVFLIPKNTADGTTISNYVQLNQDKNYSYFGTSIFYDKDIDKVIVLNGIYNNTSTNSFMWYLSSDLSEINFLRPFGNDFLIRMQNNSNFNFKIFQENQYPNTIIKNTFNNVIFTSYSCAFDSFSIISNPNNFIGVSSFNILNDDGLSKTDNQYQYWIGEKTGNIFEFVSNGLIIYDYKMNKISSKTFPDSTDAIGFNKWTEEFYRIVNNQIFMYDRYGNPITTSVISLDRPFTRIFCIAGTSEPAPYAISPNKIVYPTSPYYISNETPTIIFKVGINPDGWTQQFRIAFDTNIEKISNGDEDTTYELVVDTWANGANYDANFNFQYSTDFDPSQNDPNNGTWNNLGTNDGLQSGGIVPDNGVSSLPNQPVYVKFTVPSNKGLTGIENGTNWYIKIFSYSKPQ